MAIWVERDDWGGPISIWSNPEGGKSYVGRCIAEADTLTEAKAQAIAELQADIVAVEALRDAPATEPFL